MVWFLDSPVSSFGRFFLDGDFVDWTERNETYFNTVLTDEDRQKFNGRFNSYHAYVARKFSTDEGEILDHEWPTEFKTTRVYKTIGSVAELLGQLRAVSAEFKEIIERFEPGIHKFNPVQLLKPNGEPYSGIYYLIAVQSFLDSFDPDQSDPEIWYKSKLSEHYQLTGPTSGISEFALRKTEFEGKHLWVEKKILGYNWIVSDELRSAMADAKLVVPKMFKMKVV
ncbi:DUF1629 domain-containing protein [uncultured Tateyamaria sp.]|uniref:imm11 family protein n=1 Tax=uncultured Tateyamaria sp. TaxID=455651 RepID=UPI00262329C0|nr:DUF1629 domain-containing protein [uncultured Tateyamaria sp.]